MKNIKFSVLISCFFGDSHDYLNQALASIYSNSIIPSEVVLIQDGPVSLELRAVINSYIRTHKIKHIILEKNKGLSHALNEGLNHISNEIVFRADADDINLKHRFSEQLKHLQGEVVLCGGNIKEIDLEGNFIGYRTCPTSHEEIVSRLNYRNPFNHMTIGFRKSVIQKLGGYPNFDFREDYALWCKVIVAGYKVQNTGNTLVNARAGSSMYARRSGIRNVFSEIKLQSFMVRMGIQPIYLAFLIGGMRSLIFILPNKIRGLIYEAFLRE